MPTIFPNIQALPGWTAVTGSSIGPDVPATFDMTQPSDGLVTALLINATGVKGGYADGMARSAAVAIPAGATSARTRFIFAVSEGHAANSQADEFGLMLTNAAGAKLYHVIQFNNSTSETMAQLDVTGPDYKWLSTGITLPKFALGLHVVEIVGAWTPTMSYISEVVVDGAGVYIPMNPVAVPAQALKWAPLIWFVEAQPDIDPLGGNEQVKLYNVQVQFA